MRTSLIFLTSVLLLQLLATTAHGIRLDRQLHEALNSKQELSGDSKSGQSSDVSAEATSGHCTSDGNCSGKAKKPVAPHDAPGAAKQQVQTPPTRINGDAQSRDQPEVRTTSHAGGKGEAAQTWPSRALPRRAQQQARTYPDALDIAEMDYSPATRRPPIHN